MNPLEEELSSLFWPFISRFADEFLASLLGDAPFEEVPLPSFPGKENEPYATFLKKLEMVRRQAKSSAKKSPSNPLESSFGRSGLFPVRGIYRPAR